MTWRRCSSRQRICHKTPSSRHSGRTELTWTKLYELTVWQMPRHEKSYASNLDACHFVSVVSVWSLHAEKIIVENYGSAVMMWCGTLHPILSSCPCRSFTIPIHWLWKQTGSNLLSTMFGSYQRISVRLPLSSSQRWYLRADFTSILRRILTVLTHIYNL